MKKIYIYTSEKIEAIFEDEIAGEIVYPHTWEKFQGTEEEARLFFGPLGILFPEDEIEEDDADESYYYDD